MTIASAKLTSRGYEFGGCQHQAIKIAEALQSRRLPMNTCFKQRVHGRRVLGHTLKDKHGRWAMEFEVGAKWSDDDHESVTRYVLLKKGEKKENTFLLKKRKYVPIVTAKPWWKVW